MTSTQESPRVGDLIVVAHPSPDVYGSDRQLLESVSAMRHDGWLVHVFLPHDGPLRRLLHQRGATTEIIPFPVLRRSSVSPAGLLRLALQASAAMLRLPRAIRRLRPAVVYVNTITIPVWLAASRAARTPVMCHLHEAEEQHPIALRRLLAAPLFMAHRIIANSRTTRRVVADAFPRLASRTAVVHNGVPGPPEEPSELRPRASHDPARLVLVGRISPRKGVAEALEALSVLRAQGVDAHLDVCGTAFTGYEAFAEQLQQRAAEPDLVGHVNFRGYVHPTWDALASADLVLVPSWGESFGNVAVEGMLAARPVIASNVPALAEILEDGRTGILTPARDPRALAAAIDELLQDPLSAQRLGSTAREHALQNFSVENYRAQVVREVRNVRGAAD